MTALTATTEELELQDQVTKTLESQGVLGKIKAQLRVAVFQAIHGSSSSSNGVGSTGSLSAVVPSANRLTTLGIDGQVALEVVRNFLECLELDHTLAVFVAEANLGDGEKDGKQSEWRQPSQLCDRVGVAKTDEHTPVLVKMLRSGVQAKTVSLSQAKVPLVVSRPEEAPLAMEKRSVEVHAKVEMTRDVTTAKLDLPPPPVAASVSVKDTAIEKEEDDDDDDQEEAEMEASMAEEVASGSFEEEWLAESVSLSHSRNDDYDFKPTSQPTQRPSRLEVREEEEDEESPAIASPPPVPAKLGAMPPLPGMSTPSMSAGPVKHDSDEEEEEQTEEDGGGGGEEEEELDDDDDDAADRLRSLEAKLKEMEAEDDTGMLQQLKVAKLEDPDEDGESEKPKRDDTSEKDGQEEDDDNYGSDFEEVEEDVDEVGSEMSEDIASMSALSESEEVAVAKTAVKDGLENDRAVENEDALNSYDYIEAVERD